jgi:hypothetical protein
VSISQRITIGGTLPRSATATLFAAAAADAVVFAWGVTGSLGSTADEFSGGLRQDRPLELVADDTDGTGFPHLQEQCERLGLTYVVHIEAGHGFTADRITWLPGMATPDRVQVLGYATPAVAVSAVRQAISGDGDAETHLDAITALLDRLTPIAMPPLTVTDDHAGAAPAAEAVT